MNKEFQPQRQFDWENMTQAEFETYFPGESSMMSLDIFRQIQLGSIIPSMSKFNKTTGETQIYEGNNQ